MDKVLVLGEHLLLCLVWLCIVMEQSIVADRSARFIFFIDLITVLGVVFFVFLF